MNDPPLYGCPTECETFEFTHTSIRLTELEYRQESDMDIIFVKRIVTPFPR